MTYIASIAKCYALLENRRTRAQRKLNRPLHSIYSIDISDRDRSAAVLVIRKCKSTGDIETQLCETGKLNSTPNAAHAPRYPILAFLMEGFA